jgi:WD40 repeat protein
MSASRYVQDFVLSVALTPDGQWVLSGSKDRGVQFWDPRTGSAQLMLQGHRNSGKHRPVSYIFFSWWCQGCGGYFLAGGGMCVSLCLLCNGRGAGCLVAWKGQQGEKCWGKPRLLLLLTLFSYVPPRPVFPRFSHFGGTKSKRKFVCHR